MLKECMTYFVVMTSILLMGDPVSGQKRTNYGTYWLQSDATVRGAFIAGYQQGLYRGADVSNGLGDTTLILAEMRPHLQGVTLNEATRKRIRAATGVWIKMNDPGEYGEAVVGAAMADLYKDLANSFISCADVLQVSMMRLRGEPAAAVNRVLEIYRRLATEEGK